MTRTIRTSVTFQHPFSLTDIDRVQPAGTYIIETDEEEIQELSFLAYKKISTSITLAADPARPGCTETALIDPTELAEALITMKV